MEPSRDRAASRILPLTEAPTSREPMMTVVATATPNATTAAVFQ